MAVTRPRQWTPALVFLIVATLAFLIPTMLDVARESWGTEQGAHGPLVLATGLWLIARERHRIAAVARPGSAVLSFGLMIPLVILFALARITSIIEIESIVMYLSLVVVFYALCGGAAVRAVWFPLVYLLFVFPPPDTLFAAITQPLKIAISQWSVDILHVLGYPVAGSGVTIQIGQYEMLVAAACAGLNSLISLTALGLFYTYLRHSSNWRYMLLLVACIIPIAVLANLVRVLMLLLITYHFGEAAGQGFFHELAGMTMFVTALLGIFVIDWVFTPLRQRWAPTGQTL
ncbi:MULTISPECIES: exosortase V [unclassified Sphingomonas]|uniref:exosortase V n=1 Tax=unclassified Sphingomonas TaxID=196159 RepID=UPI001F561CBB|nr:MULTISPECIES: exosortase V [unclassified Sphingomonas]